MNNQLTPEQRLEMLTTTNRQSPDSRGKLRNPAGTGVTAAWLAHAFGMNPITVKKKLRNCPVYRIDPRGQKMETTLYDLPVAAAFLVTPAYSIEEYLRSVRKADLPPAIQQSVWDALLKRQKWEENAGQLWRTEKVREVLGGTFQTIKFTTNIWLEMIERQTAMTDEQRKIIAGLVRGLQGDIYDAMVKMDANGATGPQASEINTLLGVRDIDLLDKLNDDEDDEGDSAVEDMV